MFISEFKTHCLFKYIKYNMSVVDLIKSEKDGKVLATLLGSSIVEPTDPKDVIQTKQVLTLEEALQRAGGFGMF